MKKYICAVISAVLCLSVSALSNGCKPKDAETADATTAAPAPGTESATDDGTEIPEYFNGGDLVSKGIEKMTVKDGTSGASVSVTDPADQLLSCISSLTAGPAFSAKGIYGSRYTVTVSPKDGNDVSFTLTGDGVVITGDIFETQNGHEYRTAYKALDTENYVSLLFALEKCFE